MSERLDKYILRQHPDFTRSRIEGLVKAGFVTVNGATAEKAGQKVAEGDEVVVEVPPPVPAVPQPEDIPLDVVFEDDDLIVVNKPAGLVVHPAPGHYTGTLVNALLHHCPGLAGIGGVARPGIVHRLDQDTSGLLVVAKTQVAMTRLAQAFASHVNVEKTYLAICHGRPPLDAGRIENLIGRHPVDRKRMAIVERNGKRAVTNWQVISCGHAGRVTLPCSGRVIQPCSGRVTLPCSGRVIQSCSGRVIQPCSCGRGERLARPQNQNLFLIKCVIETGRTHQIRVHLASLGCPVVGDRVYGKPALDRQLSPVPARQLLHAWRLSLWHPTKGVKLSFEAPLPADFQDFL